LLLLLLLFQRAEHLREIRLLAKKAVAKRVAKRVIAYKQTLRKNLPSQIEKWDAREKRLFQLIAGKTDLPIDVLLVRECPDPPEEVDPDTDEEETKKSDDAIPNETLPELDDDPTTQTWTRRHVVSAKALDISQKQRTRLRLQAFAMTLYCSKMTDRAKTMLRFINFECPDDRGDVLTLFRRKYPELGLRFITKDVAEKVGIKDPDTFTRWRKHYMTTGYFQPDRRGRFTSGFLLRHDDLKDKLRQWLLGRLKRDININDVCGACHTHMIIPTYPPTVTPHVCRLVISSTPNC